MLIASFCSLSFSIAPSAPLSEQELLSCCVLSHGPHSPPLSKEVGYMKTCDAFRQDHKGTGTTEPQPPPPSQEQKREPYRVNVCQSWGVLGAEGKQGY